MSLLVKPEPFSQEFDRLFTRLFDTSGGSPQRWVPAMDLTEADDHFVLKADLPGLDDEDVSIEVQDDTLTISGERRAEHVQREKGWHRVERSFGRFSRALALPDGINADAVTAEFDRGVLTVRIPKPEARQPRKIQIGVGNGQPAAVEGAAEEK
jgi:HSP20 family protein